MWGKSNKDDGLPNLIGSNFVKVRGSFRKKFFLGSHIQEFTQVGIQSDSKDELMQIIVEFFVEQLKADNQKINRQELHQNREKEYFAIFNEDVMNQMLKLNDDD